MYPHERSLVKELANQSFALLGINSDKINSDADKDKLKQVLQKEAITWRSWIDGSTNGPIATSWNVEGWPTIYVLDHKGVIRFKDVRGPRLEQAIVVLLNEQKREAIAAAREAKRAQSAPTKAAVRTEDSPKPDRVPDEKDKQDEQAFNRLRMAKTLVNDGKFDKARERLQDLLKKFPKSPAAEEAKELLKKLK